MKYGKWLFPIGLLVVSVANADNQISLVLGVGAPYAGLGGNISMVSEKELKYLALGCMARYENSNGSSGNACGVGIGWMWTDLTKKHGLGLYAGPVSARRLSVDDVDTIYGLGASYTYFFNDAGKRGFQLGATPALGREGGERKGYLLLNFGYQF